MSDTNLMIEAINAAEDNEQLAELALSLFDLTVSKRRSIETNKGILLGEVKLLAEREAAEDSDDSTTKITKSEDGGVEVKTRLLKNKQTGATFIYTRELAAIDYMVEVD